MVPPADGSAVVGAVATPADGPGVPADVLGAAVGADEPQAATARAMPKLRPRGRPNRRDMSVVLSFATIEPPAARRRSHGMSAERKAVG